MITSQTLVFLFLFALFAFNSKNRVECFCSDLIQQYYQCKYLIMVKNTSPVFTIYGVGQAYIPDASIQNNQLTDTFYKSLNIGQMTFDQAMQLFWNIYDETNKCISQQFCECMKKSVSDQGVSALIFRNPVIFPQMKSIFSAFINKFAANISPYSQLVAQFYPTSTSSTINQFCINYDFSFNRVNYYPNAKSCMIKNDPLVFIYDMIFMSILSFIN